VLVNECNFLTNHARVLVCISQNCSVRLREIAATLGISERTASAIVTDLTEAGYVIKDKDGGRRNNYRVQTHLPLPEAVARQLTIGEVLELLIGTSTRSELRHFDRHTGRQEKGVTPPRRSGHATEGRPTPLPHPNRNPRQRVGLQYVAPAASSTRAAALEMTTSGPIRPRT
jgi:DNA-binding transcriptional ArsR family regulator